jgi:hypothetical protein
VIYSKYLKGCVGVTMMDTGQRTRPVQAQGELKRMWITSQEPNTTVGSVAIDPERLTGLVGVNYAKLR